MESIQQQEGRRRRSAQKLREVGISLSAESPLIDLGGAALRSPQAAARRALALYNLLGVIFYEHPAEVVRWTKAEKLWDDLSPAEKEVFSIPIAADLDEAEKAWRQRSLQSNLLTWRIEALWALLWALNLIDELGLPREKCAGGLIADLMPPLGSETNAFIAGAKLRPLSDILDELDLHVRINWHLEEMGEGNDIPFDSGIVYERLHALAWLIGWHEEWDD